MRALLFTDAREIVAKVHTLPLSRLLTTLQQIQIFSLKKTESFNENNADKYANIIFAAKPSAFRCRSTFQRY